MTGRNGQDCGVTREKIGGFGYSMVVGFRERVFILLYSGAIAAK